MRKLNCRKLLKIRIECLTFICGDPETLVEGSFLVERNIIILTALSLQKKLERDLLPVVSFDFLIICRC